MNPQLIAEQLSLFRAKYGEIPEGLFHWITHDRRLTNAVIEAHFDGLKLISGYLSHSTTIFAFDIDSHGRYISQALKAHDLAQKYGFIVDSFGPPAFVFRSSESGGIHVYYKMDTRILFEAVRESILARLGMTERELAKREIEILPTPRKPLRLPNAVKAGGCLLDPVTLKPARDLDPEAIILNAPARSFVDIFQAPPRVADIFTRHASTRRQAAAFRAEMAIEDWESRYPFLPGRTNEALLGRAFTYWVNGLSIDEAIERTKTALEQASISLDGKSHGKRIRQRMEALYERLEARGDRETIPMAPKKAIRDTYNTKQFRQDADLFQNEAVTGIMAILHLTGKRAFAVRLFLINLYRWTRYIETMPTERRMLLAGRFLGFFKRTSKEGLVPLPYSLLRKWSSSWNKYLELLKVAGVVTLTRKAFNPYTAKLHNPDILGTCNYYRVNFDVGREG